MDCSLPGSSVHGIFQAIVLEWIAISFSRGSSQSRDQTRVSRIVNRHFTVCATRDVLNQGKLEAVKQEMARVNINILGISELKWTGMGEFNSDDHYIYYWGQESLRRNGVALINQQNSLKCSTWVQPQKWQNDLSSFSRQIIQHHRNPSLCSYHQCQKSWSVLWRPRRSPRTNTKKSFTHHCRLEWKSRKSKILGVTGKFSLGEQNEAGQRQETTLYMDISK